MRSEGVPSKENIWEEYSEMCAQQAVSLYKKMVIADLDKRMFLQSMFNNSYVNGFNDAKHSAIEIIKEEK